MRRYALFIVASLPVACHAFVAETKSFHPTKTIQSITGGLSAVSFRGGDGFSGFLAQGGAGKSTLLYALSGMDAITSGKILFEDREISGMSEGRMARLRARAFEFVFQQTHLVSNLTLEENVAVAGY